MPVDPLRQRFIQRRGHDHAGVDCGKLGFIERHAQAQAGRAATVLHALLEVEDLDLGDRAGIGNQPLQVAPDVGIGLAFLWHDQ